MEDPIITTRAAAELLGVSIRTAQTWIEQNALESWKTPGGHRRVRRSAVLELMSRLGHAQPRRSAFVVVHASQHRLQRYCDALSLVPECAVLADGDPFAALLTVGYLMPSVIVVEINRTDRDRLQMIRRIGEHPRLAHTRILAVSDMSAEELAGATALGDRLRVLPLDSTADALRHSVREMIRDTDTGSGAGTSAAAQPPADGLRAATASNESQRLAAVAASGLAGTPEEAAFDEITQLAASTLEVPIALLTVLTPDRQWFKSHWGLEQNETPRSWAFCNFTILQNDVFIVEDATLDLRFADNPLVTGAPHIRFYAGVSVRDIQGYPLGSLCVIDTEPRRLVQAHRNALMTLGGLASDRINLRLRERQLRWAQNDAD